jgi:hypothetical protein
MKLFNTTSTPLAREAWIKHRQDRSSVPWDDVAASGFDAVACDCGKQGCQGWRLARAVARPPAVSQPVAPSPHQPQAA